MMTADSLRLAAYGSDEDEMRIARDLPNATPPHEQESLQRQTAATDRRIDDLVYELCGLTDDEIRLVEGSHH